MRDDLETLYGVDDAALDVKLAVHAKKELEAYHDCGAALPATLGRVS